MSGFRRLCDDRGATMVMMAIAMVSFIGMAAVVVDLGSGWRNRRALIPGTDAAALAAAQDYANDKPGTACSFTAQHYLTQNAPTATLDSCNPGGSTDHGWVTVTASDTTQTWFSSVVGRGDYDVESASSAVFAPPAAVTGMRPIAFCIEGSSELENVVYNPPSGQVQIEIEMEKDDPSDCGGSNSPDNFAVVNFNGGSYPNSTRYWIRNGYDGEVVWEDHTVSSCGDSHCYDGRIDSYRLHLWRALRDLENSGDFVPWPVYNYIDSSENIHFMGFIRARLHDYDISGTNQEFELDVLPGLVAGICCGDGAGASGNKIVAICGVDPSDTTACQP